MSKTPSLSKVHNKKELLELQRFFAQMIRRPLLEASKMPKDGRIASMIKENSQSSSHQRLEFYAQQYWWRIIAALDDDFPTLQKILPLDIYEKLRLKYLEKCPSESFTLRNLGSRFPQFIKENPRLTKPNHRLATDAARFDWELIETFDAAEAIPLTVDMVHSPKFPAQKLYLQPHVRLIELNYPVQRAFKLKTQAHSEAASNTLTAKSRKLSAEIQLQIPREKTFLAIHRFQNRPHFKELSKARYEILSAIRKGRSLYQLVNLTSSITHISDTELQDCFSEWMALGWIYLEKHT